MDKKMEKAVQILEQSCPIALASVNEEGFPRVCVLAPIKNEGIKQIWFSTGTTTVKVKQFLKNSKASVCYYDGDDSVTLIGNVEIIDDMQAKKDLWQDWLIDHFKGGAEDENFCPLKFSAINATMWIDGEYATIEL